MTAAPRRWVTLLTLLLLACVLPLGGAQAAASTENVATAITEQDSSHVFDFAWDVSRVRGHDDVKTLNQATARASCIQCGATAIAFQIVLASGSSTVIPRNYAVAMNEECTACVVGAEARQFIRVFPKPVRFTAEGRAVLDDVRNQLAALEYQNLPLDQLHQAVEAQEARVREVLQDNLVLKSDPGTEAEFVKQRTFQSADLY